MTNDQIVLKKLKHLDAEKIKDLVAEAEWRGYKDLEDQSILVDVLYTFFPFYPVSVYDKNQETNKSILFLEDLLRPLRKTQCLEIVI